MRKIFSFLSFLILISILMTSGAYAFDITAGATAWHANWDSNKPMREDYELQGARAPSFLYGPVVSLKFNDDFNLTFVYLYGEFTENINCSSNSMAATTVGKAKIKRNDSDLALNYRLNNFFKIFAGVKYINFKYSILAYTGYPELNINDDIEHSGIGPGLGLNAAFPVAENLFLVGTFSGFYLWGNEKENYRQVQIFPPPTVESGWSDKYKYREYGVNSNISFAVYIPPAVAISLGYRYQYAKAVYKDSMYNNTSKFHGLNLAATYTFSI